MYTLSFFLFYSSVILLNIKIIFLLRLFRRNLSIFIEFHLDEIAILEDFTRAKIDTRMEQERDASESSLL